MTTQTVFPTPLPQGQEPDAGDPGGGRPAPPAYSAQPTIHEVFRLLNERRAAVHEELQELRVSGAPVNVPFDAVFLCELAGLVVDLETGAISGLAEGRAPWPQAPHTPLGAQSGRTVDGEATPA